MYIWFLDGTICQVVLYARSKDLHFVEIFSGVSKDPVFSIEIIFEGTLAEIYQTSGGLKSQRFGHIGAARIGNLVGDIDVIFLSNLRLTQRISYGTFGARR